MIEACLQSRRHDEAVDGADTASENDGGAVEILRNDLTERFEGARLVGCANPATRQHDSKVARIWIEGASKWNRKLVLSLGAPFHTFTR